MKWTGILNCATKRGDSRLRGFTLTELAIVLGVIGLILGSIWGLAAQTWENTRQEQLKDNIFSTVKNVRAYYQSQNGILGAGYGINAMTANLAVPPPGLGVIPGDMVRTGAGSGCTNTAAGGQIECADNPWGVTAAALIATGSFGICAWQYGAGGTTSCTVGAAAAQQFFAIELKGMPQGACIKAAMLNSGATAPPGLYDVFINGTSIVNGAGITHQLPPLAGDAQTLCGNVTPATVDFIYRLVAPQS